MSPMALAWQQFRFERKLFWRNPSAAFFNFLLPLLFLVLIATAFGSDRDDLEILVPGIAGMAVMTTTFTALAFNITFLREQGILKRIQGTPLPALNARSAVDTYSGSRSRRLSSVTRRLRVSRLNANRAGSWCT